MKILLDENLPRKLRTEIEQHEAVTTAYLGWTGITNGELLTRAARHGFEALITTDRGIEYEQNQRLLPVAVVVLEVKTNTIEAIRPLYPKLHATLQQLQPGQLVRIGPDPA